MNVAQLLKSGKPKFLVCDCTFTDNGNKLHLNPEGQPICSLRWLNTLQLQPALQLLQDQTCTRWLGIKRQEMLSRR